MAFAQAPAETEMATKRAFYSAKQGGGDPNLQIRRNAPKFELSRASAVAARA